MRERRQIAFFTGIFAAWICRIGGGVGRARGTEREAP